MVNDLTCVEVANTWHYICLLIDLINREFDGYSAGKNKDSNLVVRANSKIIGQNKKVSRPSPLTFEALVFND